jgi:hypothetical protein
LVLLHLLIWTPITVATLISLTIKPILLDRSLIAISTPLYLLMGLQFVRFWRKHVTRVVVLAFVSSSLIGLGYVYPNTRHPNDLIRLSHHIVADRRPGDAVAFADWQAFETSAMLYPDQRDVYILPAPSLSKAQWASEEDWKGRLTYIGWHSPKNVQTVTQFGPRYRRVWLIFTHFTPNLEYQVNVNQAWLREHGRLIERLNFTRAAVYLYEITP